MERKFIPPHEAHGRQEAAPQREGALLVQQNDNELVLLLKKQGHKKRKQ